MVLKRWWGEYRESYRLIAKYNKNPNLVNTRWYLAQERELTLYTMIQCLKYWTLSVCFLFINCFFFNPIDIEIKSQLHGWILGGVSQFTVKKMNFFILFQTRHWVFSASYLLSLLEVKFHYYFSTVLKQYFRF